MQTICGRYELQRGPFRGGFGEVWFGQDLRTGQAVACKRVPAADVDDRRAIRRELVAMRLARFPGVVRLRDDEADDAGVWIVMDLVEGDPFPGRAPAGGWTWEALRVPLRGLLEAVARLHAAGVQHRDIKPANVLVDARGGVCLLDLGFARGPDLRLSARGGYEATMLYAAPEQRRADDGQDAGDGRADLFPIGVMLYEALTGRRPWTFASAREAWLKLVVHPEDPPVEAIGALVPGLPSEAAALVMHLMAPRPEDRPAGAVEVLRRLGAAEAVEGHGLVEALPDLASEEELRGLFEGPEPFLHLAGDAAAALWRRTGGRRRRVAEELEAWLRSGRATRGAGGVTVDRAAIERLLAGEPLRVGRPAAALSAPASSALSALRGGWPGLHTDALAERLGAAPEEVEVALEELQADDRVWRDAQGRWVTAPLISEGAVRGSAAALLVGDPSDLRARLDRELRAGDLTRAWALAAVGATLGRSDEEDLLADLTVAALTLADDASLQRTLRILEDVDVLSGRREAWCQLLRAQRAAVAQRDPERAAALLAATGEVGDVRLDVWRWAVELPVRLQRGLGEAEAWLASLPTSGDPYRESKRLGWLGVVRYRQGRYREAAELHAEAAARKERTDERLASQANQAAALLEAGDLAACARIAGAVEAEARLHRLARYELLGRSVAAGAAYRAGREVRLDAGELEAARRVDLAIGAALGLSAAAWAWRQGDADEVDRRVAEALPLAQEARLRPGGLLLRALTASLRGGGADLLDEVAACGPPLIAAQALALLEAARGDPRWQALAERLWVAVDADDASWREVLSPAEVASRLSHRTEVA